MQKGWSGQQPAERFQLVRDHGVPGPQAALLASEDAGCHQDLEMVTDGRLTEVEGFRQVSHAGFPVSTGLDHGEKLEPGRVGQCFQHRGETFGFVAVDGGAGDLVGELVD